MRIEFLELTFIVFKFFTDEQKRHFTTAPYRFAQIIAEMLSDDHKNTRFTATRILGDLFYEKSSLCTYIVCEMKQNKRLIECLQFILASGTSKER